MGGGILSQQRGGIAAHAYDGDVHVEHHGDEAQEFVGLTGIRDGKYDIIARHHTKVAMEDIKRIDKERRCAGAGERGCNLCSYKAALTHASDNDLAMAVEHEFHGSVETIVYLRNKIQ